MSQIIASLTRESIVAREAAVHSLPWSQTEKKQCLGQMQSQTSGMGL